MKQKYWYWGIPLIGVLFCLWYVREATVDVIYSDYVRLVNSYLPDVYNPEKFFVADILTRIPVNYLGRIINIAFFDFSITFDRVLGVLGLGLSAAVCTSYCIKYKIRTAWFLVFMGVFFSLNKWEMLTNGSGWSHFLAFAGFYYHYLVIDRVYRGEEKTYDRLRLCVLPFVITLLLAGPYCAIYSVTVILAYGFVLVTDVWRKKRPDKRYIIYAVCTLIPLLLYIVSNSYAVEDHSGAVNQPLLPVLVETPSFFVRFMIKSFSSMVMGEEVMRELFSSDGMIFFIGGVVFVTYFLALWMNFKFGLYKKTLIPLIFIVSGGLNHILILLSRWIFLNENYGMSSRYALQFQIGILGILFTFALVWGKAVQKKKWGLLGIVLTVSLLLLGGNLYTSYQECKKAPYREASFEKIAVLARNFENETDDTLRAKFEYRQKEESSGMKIRAALTILKENEWNIFSEDHIPLQMEGNQ